MRTTVTLDPDVAARLRAVAGWLAQPCAVILHPSDRHAALVREFLRPLGTAGNLVNDATWRRWPSSMAPS
jgi:hypothetical protein